MWIYAQPEKIQDLTLDQYRLKNLKTIGKGFLSFGALTSIDFGGLPSLTTIGSCFLSRSFSLWNIDLSHLIGVRHIGGDFLGGSTLTPEARAHVAEFKDVVRARGGTVD